MLKTNFSKHFYGGMVGFKNGSGRHKWKILLIRQLDLMRELKEVEEKIDRLKKPFN